MSHISSGENDYRYPPPVPRDKRVDTGEIDPRTTYDLSAERGSYTDDNPFANQDPFPTSGPYPQTGPYRRQTESGLQPVTGHIRPGHRTRPRTTSRAIAPRATPVRGATRPNVRPPSQSGGLIARAVVGGLCLLLLAGAVGWFLNRGGDDETEETAVAEEAATETVEEADTGVREETTTTVALTPVALPEITEAGLVLYEMQLLDAYTGTGAAGMVELYMNALNGQICHVFNVAALNGQYLGFVNQAFFPRQGPSVINLGATANAVPQCVSASPIEVARAMVNPDEFYVAAIDLDGKILLRGQMSEATIAVDNRDDATRTNQQALAGDPTTGSEADGTELFDNENDGAFIEIDDRTVMFKGAVPDQATADNLLAAFLQLSGQGVQVVDELQVQEGAPAPSGRVVIGNSLLFGVDEDQLTGEPVVLETLADLLRVNPTWTATVAGHTDNFGLAAYNRDLSLRRANTVRQRLAELGIAENRISVEGFGADDPIGDNNTNEGRAANRRIEITINS